MCVFKDIIKRNIIIFYIIIYCGRWVLNRFDIWYIWKIAVVFLKILDLILILIYGKVEMNKIEKLTWKGLLEILNILFLDEWLSWLFLYVRILDFLI